jgi:hypothetical protein
LIYERGGDTLYVSFLEYRTKRVVITRPGEVVVALEPIDVELEAVEIVEEAARATEAAVAVERLRSLERLIQQSGLCDRRRTFMCRMFCGGYRG